MSLTPRAKDAIETTISEYYVEQSVTTPTLEKLLGWTSKRLIKKHYLSVEHIVTLSQETWEDALPNMPLMLLPKIRQKAQEAMSPGRSSILELQCPGLQYGKKGQPISLLTNHFLLDLSKALPAISYVWLAWQLEFPPATTRLQKGGGKGGAREPREPGKAIRQAAVSVLLKGLEPDSWLFDGRSRLYTRKDRPMPPTGKHHLTIEGAKLPIEVQIAMALSQQELQQELNLSGLFDSRRWKPHEPVEAFNEERRFLQVCMRSFAVFSKDLVTQGRRIVCPYADTRLLFSDNVASDLSLKHGRELWFGYFAQIELIDGPKGPRCSLNLNLVGSVGIRQMSAVDLVARIIAKPGWNRDAESFIAGQLRKNVWPKELDPRMLNTLNSEMGLKKLRVSVEYFGQKRTKTVVGITRESANRRKFWLEEERRDISVAEYFAKKYPDTPLQCPDLPCLELGKAGNCVPIELVTILGGEHNILVGKLRPEYQAEATKHTAMQSSRRRLGIQNVLENVNLGPRESLREKGIDVQLSMLELNGRVLQAPSLEHGGSQPIHPNSYANNVKAVQPPDYEVPWGLWSYTSDDQGALDCFAKQFRETGKARNIWFQKPRFVGTQSSEGTNSQANGKSWKSFFSDDAAAFKASLEDDLRTMLRDFAQSSPLGLLVVLLPNDDFYSKRAYGSLKFLTETGLRFFATQCIQCNDKKGGLQGAERKLNNLMVKVTSKLPRSIDKHGTGQGTAHNVQLMNPSSLLDPKKHRTIVIGADVTHNVVGVSVAGVVATRDTNFAAYFSQVRGQTPFVLEGDKKRRRKSEERIIELKNMVELLLQRWQSANEGLPDTVLYYRDGVSDGQFMPVLTRELNELMEAFHRFEEGRYSPKLAIIVGQKRHQTRLFRNIDLPANTNHPHGKAAEKGGKGWPADDAGKSKGKGKGAKGGKGPDASDVPPGTVAGEGVAQPGHLNFFLVAHQGIKGTSVPCHYHVLHLDQRLVEQSIGIDDLERITYDLCHVYSRADKTVSYASPTYLADHLCERGKLYLEMQYPDSCDVESTARSEEQQEELIRKTIEERVSWFNETQNKINSGGLDDLLQGKNFFC